MTETAMTITGNLVADPELRFTPAGQPVATFRVASTPRYRDNATGEWKDGDSLFLSCVAWRQMAENVAESLTRGLRVIVTGRLRQRSYETKEGEKRTGYELQVDEAGPSLRNASAKVTKAARPSGTQANGGGETGPWPSEASGGHSDEPAFLAPGIKDARPALPLPGGRSAALSGSATRPQQWPPGPSAR